MSSLGTVSHLTRYPVKSMTGEELQSAVIESHGFLGDRVYAFVLEHPPNPQFPWMTARQAPNMLLYKPSFHSDQRAQVKCPDGGSYSINDVALKQRIEKESGQRITLLCRDAGCQDVKPISILGLQSIERLAQEIHIGTLDTRRFRANIYINWESGEPFLEDSLLGDVVRIGESVKLRIVKKDSRCVIPTFDPATAEPSPSILEAIKANHSGCFGVYAEVQNPGVVKLEDTVSIV